MSESWSILRDMQEIIPFSPHSISLRPREKITEGGIEGLTTAELLSVILGSGIKNVPVHVLAKRIFEKLTQRKSIKLSDLTSIKGVGRAKGCQILAAIELVERFRPIGYPMIDCLDKVLMHVNEIRYANRETIICLYLNARMQLVLKETLSIGSVNQSVLQPRDIFSVIKYHPVSYLILAHNHPSGDPTPSGEDQRFTHVIQEAGHLLGLDLLDHVIVAKDQHTSCRELGWMREETELAKRWKRQNNTV
jgi:DNA repair protein RadC